MHIKIREENELKLLRRVNQLFGKYRIPEELFIRAEDILSDNDLGREGYIAILLNPIERDDEDIRDELSLNRDQYELPDNNYKWIQIRWGKHPMRNDRVWNSYDMVLHESQGKIYVIYSLSKDRAKELGVDYYA